MPLFLEAPPEGKFFDIPSSDRRRIFGMPEKETLERAREDEREGKSPSTQAGEFVREEMEHIREGEHGASSAKQAIAIGLSKARRPGVKLPPPRKRNAPSPISPRRPAPPSARKAPRPLARKGADLGKQNSRALAGPAVVDCCS